MILQALTDHYQTLVERGEIAKPGWGPAKVSFALSIDEQGTLEQVLFLKSNQERGKKMVLAPQIIELPAPVKRSSGIAPNFLCDNASYFLGADNKGKPERSLACFSACKTFHETVLNGVASPAAQSVLAFFRSWQPEQAATHPALAEYQEEIFAGANLIFSFNGRYVHEDPLVCHAWDTYYAAQDSGEKMVCLVTGELGPVEAVHPPIKNVPGAQSSGAALVSFNAPAFCSYGKEQNLNAPTSKFASFAYTSALNHLLADREHVYHLGDSTVVCWAQNGDPSYQELAAFAAFSQSEFYSFQDIENVVKSLCCGKTVEFDHSVLDPDMTFYILGISPNAARLSIRFFFKNSFGVFLENIQKHQERLKIAKPAYDTFDFIPFWKLLDETANQNSRDKSPSPHLAGDVLRSVLANTPYPATLLNGVALRIRAEQRITPGRAAILKAYYLQNPHSEVPKEVLRVSLNPNSTNVPYNLGRLFSILEAIQSAANPHISATIKDRYFNAASSTPAIIFPSLLNLAQKHLKKLDAGLQTYYNKQLSQLMSQLAETFPTRLNRPQQGSFQLGYYHQTQARYQKKEEK